MPSQSWGSRVLDPKDASLEGPHQSPEFPPATLDQRALSRDSYLTVRSLT